MLAANRKPPDNAGVGLPTDARDENANSGATAGDSSTLLDAETATPAGEKSAPVDVARREFEFPGVLAAVPEYRDRVMQFVVEHCPDEGDQIDVLVALQEALANAALHGCKDDPAKKIRCVVTADESEITISVSDPGPGFDLALADPENYRLTTLTHGRGICLIRSLVSEVTCKRRGAEILLRKRIHSNR